jgi:hypothetical protein
MPDVIIDMGFMHNHAEKVRLTFRRPVDSDVDKEIMGLKARYGWKICTPIEGNQASEMLFGTYTIDCVGAKSDEVGNAIGNQLVKEHGLKVQYSQFIKLGPGRSC